MTSLHELLDVFLHVDKHLLDLVSSYGAWVYGVLFLVVFCETGLVVTPFLPGDSLLFAAGALAGMTTGTQSPLSIVVVVPLLVTAAVLGDAVNFAIGARVGPAIFEKEKVPFIKRAHLERTQGFYERHGSKTIVLARFVPIVRTFAPFVAGIGRMQYGRFALFNVVGAVLWVSVCAGAGYAFGELEVVKKNFELVVLGIVFVSVLPLGIEFLRARRAKT